MAFKDTLEAWYAEHGRSLPWRGIDDAYKIWLSEIILQQTRIEQGRDYYLRFVEALPTVAHLAAADEEEVLRLWQGLGYYSRARNLHAAAQQVMEEYGGSLPTTYEGLRKLKGVGRYTAAAIASFAFRLPHPVIDGNVYRFVSRLRGISTPIGTDAAYSEFEALLLTMIDRNHPDRFNAAMMDFGSMQCRPMPDCANCPFGGECVALQSGRIELLPVKAPKRQPTERWFYYLDLDYHGLRPMHQRTEQDIWRGLWELPLIEYGAPLEGKKLATAVADYLSSQFGITGIKLSPAGQLTHKLTHRTIHARFLRAELVAQPAMLPPNTRLVSPNELAKLPISRLIDKYLHNL